MTEFGIWDRRYGRAVDILDYLTDSYIRRKKFEWEQQAIATINALAKAMNNKDSGKGTMSLDKISAMGVKIRNTSTNGSHSG